MVRSYDVRATSSASTSSHSIMAPQYSPALAQYNGPMNTIISAPQVQSQHYNPFGYGSYSGPSPNGMIPAFSNSFLQPRPLPRLLAPNEDSSEMTFSRTTTQPGFYQQHQSQSPQIKTEPQWGISNNTSNYSPTNPVPKSEPLWNVSTSLPSFRTTSVPATKGNSSKPTTPEAPSTPTEVDFGTDVDILMKAIQAKNKKVSQPQLCSPIDQVRHVVRVSHESVHKHVAQAGWHDLNEFMLTRDTLQQEEEDCEKSKRRFLCTIKNCNKAFSQKTHLDIHERKHNGSKPYVSHCPILFLGIILIDLQPCKLGCGKWFSQAGNLRVRSATLLHRDSTNMTSTDSRDKTHWRTTIPVH